MNLPSLPTDNLYKFVAFLGLLLVISSPFYYQVFSHEVILRNMELRGEMQRLEKETGYLEHDVDREEKRTEEYFDSV